MKRTTLLFAVLFVVVGISQVNAQAGFQLGLKGGLNFANVSADDFDPDSRTGYHIGAFTMIKLGKVGIQPELVFSRQGYEVELPNDVVNELRSSYVNIPVILKFYLIQGLNIQVGPQVGFVTGGEFETRVNDAVTGEFEAQDYLNGTDISLALGAGVDLPFGLNVTARYNLGLNDARDDDFGAANTSSEFRNQVFQLSVGLALIKN